MFRDASPIRKLQSEATYGEQEAGGGGGRQPAPDYSSSRKGGPDGDSRDAGEIQSSNSGREVPPAETAGRSVIQKCETECASVPTGSSVRSQASVHQESHPTPTPDRQTHGHSHRQAHTHTHSLGDDGAPRCGRAWGSRHAGARWRCTQASTHACSAQ